MSQVRDPFRHRAGASRRSGNLCASHRGFTLVELLFVVAVLAILAAVAVPHFLEAQTRSKVSAAKANLRVLSGGIEMYFADHTAWPPSRGLVPEDPYGIYADKQLSRITTPIAYVTAGSFRDPFGLVQARGFTPLVGVQRGRNDFPALARPNEQRSLLFYHYDSIAERLGKPDFSRAGCALISIGPDTEDSLGAFRPMPANFFHQYFQFLGNLGPADTIYDPTNGTVSSGDIAAFLGDARRFAE